MTKPVCARIRACDLSRRSGHPDDRLMLPGVAVKYEEDGYIDRRWSSLLRLRYVEAMQSMLAEHQVQHLARAK